MSALFFFFMSPKANASVILTRPHPRTSFVLSLSPRGGFLLFLLFCVSQSKRGRTPPPPRARLSDVDPATPTRQVDTLKSARVTLTGGCVTLTGVPPVTLGPRPGPRPATIGGDTTLDRTIGMGGEGACGRPRKCRFSTPHAGGFWGSVVGSIDVSTIQSRSAGGTPADSSNVFYYPGKIVL